MNYRGEFPWSFDTDGVTAEALARFARQCLHIVATVAAYAPAVRLPWTDWVSDVAERIERELSQDLSSDNGERARLQSLAEHCAHVACDVVAGYDKSLLAQCVEILREDLLQLQAEPAYDELPSQTFVLVLLRRLDERITSDRQLQAFLCHCSADKPQVRLLAAWLRSIGVSVWLDEEALLPGEEWSDEIRRAIIVSDVVIVVLSSRAVTKVGFVQREIRYALDAADEQPDGAMYIVPVCLEDCNVPLRLHRWHWVDISEPSGYRKLAGALTKRARSLGLRPPSNVAEMGA